MPAARELLLLGPGSPPAAIKAFREAMEATLAEAGSHPGRRWKPWETASIRAVDTAGIGPLRVQSWRFRRPKIPAAWGWLTPLRCVSQPTRC